MKKIVRLTESDLVKLVKRVIEEQTESEVMNATPITLRGMAIGEAIKMLADNGFIYKTDGSRVSQYVPGLYKFVFNEGVRMVEPLKTLINNIQKQLKSNNAQTLPAGQGLGASYMIDIIGTPGYQEYVKGN